MTGIVCVWNDYKVWEVSGTDEFATWYDELDKDEQSAIEKRIDLLADQGPALRRPVVGEITSSKYQNMKEPRASAGPAKLRVLFLFDPRREAILLLGGDKSEDQQWNYWYPTAIATAETLYENYLNETGQHDDRNR